jgi:hypothetical protein
MSGAKRDLFISTPYPQGGGRNIEIAIVTSPNIINTFGIIDASLIANSIA